MPHQTELEMAARHVREGEIDVVRQSELLERLRVDGHEPERPRTSWFEFETILAAHSLADNADFKLQG